MKKIFILLTMALTGICTSAFAQWQWIDKDGRKVFSDRAPPTDIPEKNILKRPGNRVVASPSEDAASASEAPASEPAPPIGKPVPSVDKELEAKKKQTLEAEAAKRKAIEEQNLKTKIENCARAKQAKATYDSGVRIGRTNAAGEREYVDGAAKAEELKRIQGILARDCQ